MINVVVLRTARVQFFIRFLVIRLLEQNIRSNPCFFELSIILDCRRCNVDVDSANRTVFVLNAVDRLNAL